MDSSFLVADTQCQSSNSQELKFANIDISSIHSLFFLVPSGIVDCTFLKCSTHPFLFTIPLRGCVILRLTLSCTPLLPSVPPGQSHVLSWFYCDSSDDFQMSFTSLVSFPELQTLLYNSPLSTCSLYVHHALKSTWLNRVHDVPPSPGSHPLSNTWVDGAATHLVTASDSCLLLHLYPWANTTDLSY